MLLLGLCALALAPTCGPLGTGDCCVSLSVPAGTFSRNYDVATDGMYSDPQFVATLGNFFSRFVIHMLGNAILLVGILALLFGIDWRVGLTMTTFALVALAVINAINAGLAGEGEGSGGVGEWASGRVGESEVLMLIAMDVAAQPRRRV